MTSIRMYDSRYWEPRDEYKSVLFKECSVAGVSFHIEADDEIWQNLHEGVEIALVRDKDNKHDRNAVAVALADDYAGDPEEFDFDLILGYIPRTENEVLARLLDAGFDDYITAKVSTYNSNAKINERIRISIFFESPKPIAVRPDLIRAKTIDFDELSDLKNQLKAKGLVHMRIGGFYDRRVFVPKVGEKIVAVCDGDNGLVTLYLLQILAKGDKCAEYLDDPNDLYMVDDCCPYILTNICGPVLINKDNYDFIAELDLSDLYPMDYLNETISHEFEMVFEQILAGVLNPSECK